MSQEVIAEPIGSSDAATATQAEITAEIVDQWSQYADSGRTETQPRYDYRPYRSSILRHPTKDLCHADPETIELAAPAFGTRDVDPLEADLTIQATGDPIGERMVVTGRVLDGAGRPVAGQLVEVWQANAAGRYIHLRDQHHAPHRSQLHRRRALPDRCGGSLLVQDDQARARTPGATTTRLGGRRTSTSRSSAPTSPRG